MLLGGGEQWWWKVDAGRREQKAAGGRTEKAPLHSYKTEGGKSSAGWVRRQEKEMVPGG